MLLQGNKSTKNYVGKIRTSQPLRKYLRHLCSVVSQKQETPGDSFEHTSLWEVGTAWMYRKKSK